MNVTTEVLVGPTDIKQSLCHNQGLVLRHACLPRASISVMGASRKLILPAPKSIKFNLFVCFCGEKIQFCVNDSDFSHFRQVFQNLNVKPWKCHKNSSCLWSHELFNIRHVIYFPCFYGHTYLRHFGGKYCSYAELLHHLLHAKVLWWFLAAVVLEKSKWRNNEANLSLVTSATHYYSGISKIVHLWTVIYSPIQYFSCTLSFWLLISVKHSCISLAMEKHFCPQCL